MINRRILDSHFLWIISGHIRCLIFSFGLATIGLALGGFVAIFILRLDLSETYVIIILAYAVYTFLVYGTLTTYYNWKVQRSLQRRFHARYYARPRR